MSGSPAAFLRLEVSPRSGFADGRALRLLPALCREHPAVRDIRIVDVYIVEHAPALRLEDARADEMLLEIRKARKRFRLLERSAHHFSSGCPARGRRRARRRIFVWDGRSISNPKIVADICGFLGPQQ